jgi:hypothetical protein
MSNSPSRIVRLKNANIEISLSDGSYLVLIKGSVMVRNVFFLGRPGSGKSMFARLMEMFAKENGWSAEYINDYRLLQKMFLQEQEKGESVLHEERKFSPSGPDECNGFDVIDFSVLDTVLMMMAEEVREKENKFPAEDKLLFLIEFARNNYSDALQHFGQDLLQDAYLIYLDVELGTCIDRVQQRVIHPMTCEDLYVSDDIMRTYYHEDDWSRVAYNLQLNCDKCVIANSGTLQDLKQEVEEWVDIHLKRELIIPDSYVTVG